MGERGLYGQTESDAGSTNAQVERFADIDGEPLRDSDGNLTERGYRLALAAEARREIEASKGETKAAREKAPEIIKGLVVRGWRQDQTDALRAQGDLAESMRSDGYSQGVVYAALTVAAPIAYHRAALEAQAGRKGFQGAPDRRDNTVKGNRRFPRA